MVPPLPPWFKPHLPTSTDLKLVSILLGWTFGFGLLTMSKALRQTTSIWRRTHSWTNLFVWMIWAEVIASLALALVAWLLINGIIPFGFTVLLIAAFCWAIQIQILPQIILNRVSLIALDKRKIFRLKIIVLIIITIINVVVFIVWIPAHMQISSTWMRVDNYVDHAQKIVYLLLDLSLNLYFLYLVRTKLVAAGLQKYKKLFWFNAAIVWVSMSMDVTIIGLMSLKSDLVYTQFHPIAFLVKLNIELTMADLIAKICRSSQRDRAAGDFLPNISLFKSTSGNTVLPKGTPLCRCGSGNKAWPEGTTFCPCGAEVQVQNATVTQTGDEVAVVRSSDLKTLNLMLDDPSMEAIEKKRPALVSVDSSSYGAVTESV